MIGDGSLSLSSKKDPRWNRTEQHFGDSFSAHYRAKELTEQLKAQLGEPPDDLTASYWKN